MSALYRRAKPDHLLTRRRMVFRPPMLVCVCCLEETPRTGAHQIMCKRCAHEQWVAYQMAYHRRRRVTVATSSVP